MNPDDFLKIGLLSFIIPLITCAQDWELLYSTRRIPLQTCFKCFATGDTVTLVLLTNNNINNTSSEAEQWFHSTRTHFNSGIPTHGFQWTGISEDTNTIFATPPPYPVWTVGDVEIPSTNAIYFTYGGNPYFGLSTYGGGTIRRYISPHGKDRMNHELLKVATVKHTYLTYDQWGIPMNKFDINLPLTISMADSIHGIATESFRFDSVPTRIYYTNNGWRTYYVLPRPWSIRANEIHYPLTIYAINDTVASIIISRNDTNYFARYSPSRDWERFVIDTGLMPVRPYFVNDSVGYIAGDKFTEYGGASRYNVVYRTTDGGRSWNRIFHQLSYSSVRQIVFKAEHGIIVGTHSLVYETLDSGKTWRWIPPIPTGDQIVTACISNKTTIIGTQSGKFYYRLHPWLSSAFTNSHGLLDSLLVYPNPTNDMLFIQGYVHPTTPIQLWSSDGRLLSTTTCTNRIDCGHLSPGLYFLRIGQRTFPFFKQ